MVVVGLMSIVLSVAYITLVTAVRLSRAYAARGDEIADARLLLDQITEELRRARPLQQCVGSPQILVDADERQVTFLVATDATGAEATTANTQEVRLEVVEIDGLFYMVITRTDSAGFRRFDVGQIEDPNIAPVFTYFYDTGGTSDGCGMPDQGVNANRVVGVAIHPVILWNEGTLGQRSQQINEVAALRAARFLEDRDVLANSGAEGRVGNCPGDALS
jgi:hypothetical protein